uniref:Uncharacterized protein n=1 Tax=Trichuris muris TaxID=70415 RepID=A0A5S6QH71_TRIMR
MDKEDGHRLGCPGYHRCTIEEDNWCRSVFHESVTDSNQKQRLLCTLSIIPLACGWEAVVGAIFMLRTRGSYFHKEFCYPWSVARTAGIPSRENKVDVHAQGTSAATAEALGGEQLPAKYVRRSTIGSR